MDEETKPKVKRKRGRYFSYLQKPHVSQGKVPRIVSTLRANEPDEDDISDGNCSFDEEPTISDVVKKPCDIVDRD